MTSLTLFGPQLGHYQIDDVITGQKTGSFPSLYCVAVRQIVLVSSHHDRVKGVQLDCDLIHFPYPASLDCNTPCVFHWTQIIIILKMKKSSDC